MSSQSVKRSRVHKKEEGTERCGHQCEGRICVNSSGSLDWNKEGNAVARHEKSTTKHPRCHHDCPSYEKLRTTAQQATSSQPRASSSQALSIPARTSERSSSLGEFDMEIDQLEPLVTEKITDKPPSTRIYKILVILEPSRRQTAAPIDASDTEWFQEDLADGALILDDPTFTGFIFPDIKNLASAEDSANGYVGVWIHEKLFMTLRWRSERLTVEYMTWEDFRDAVDSIDEENPIIPHSFIPYDLIWGGADFNLDLVRTQYGFTTANKVKRHADRLRALSRLVPVWPPVDEILAASRKADIIQVFDRIANEVTHTVRPTTNLLTLPLNTLPRDVVLKREGSDTSSHVLLPQQLQDTTLKALNKTLRGRFRWFSQNYIPELRQFGEWRVFIVDGNIIEIITTQPDDTVQGHNISVGVLLASWSLEELTKLYKANPQLSCPEAVVREGGTIEQRRLARMELEDFALRTYNAIVDDSQSSLRFMCRLDIGVMMNKNTQRLEYFINELERGTLISLFSVIGNGMYIPHRFGDETKQVLLKLLDNHYS